MKKILCCVCKKEIIHTKEQKEKLKELLDYKQALQLCDKYTCKDCYNNLKSK